jgi:hypothetical protein
MVSTDAVITDVNPLGTFVFILAFLSQLILFSSFVLFTINVTSLKHLNAMIWYRWILCACACIQVTVIIFVLGTTSNVVVLVIGILLGENITSCVLNAMDIFKLQRFKMLVVDEFHDVEHQCVTQYNTMDQNLMTNLFFERSIWRSLFIRNLTVIGNL